MRPMERSCVWRYIEPEAIGCMTPVPERLFCLDSEPKSNA